MNSVFHIWKFGEKHYLCTAFEKRTYHWRDGRVIDCSGLENRRTARYRGFESLSLRKKDKSKKDYHKPNPTKSTFCRVFSSSYLVILLLFKPKFSHKQTDF